MSLICEQCKLLDTLYKNKKAIVSSYNSEGNLINTDSNKFIMSELVINGCGFKISGNILQNPFFTSSQWDELEKCGMISVENEIEFNEGVGQLLNPAYKLTLLRIVSSDSILQGYILIIEDISEQKLLALKNRAYMGFSLTLSFGKVITWKYEIKSRNVIIFYDGEFITISIQDIFEKIHPSDRKTVKEVIVSMRRGLEDRHLFIIRIRECANSPYLYYRILLTAVYDDKNNIVSISGNQQDISDVVQREKALEKAKNKMFTMNRQLKDVLYMGKIIPCFIDVKKGIVRISSNVRKDKLGTAAPHKFVMHINECLANIHPDDVDDVLSLFTDVMSLKRSDGVVRLRYDATGEFKKYYLFAVTRTGGDSSGDVLTGYLQDITETEMLIHKLIESNKKSEEGERIKSEFLANISHEIRTPMNQILGFSELLAKSDDAGDRDQYYQVIQNSCTNFLKLINDLVKVSDIELNHAKRSLRVFDVTLLFLSLYNYYKERNKNSAIDFILDEIPSKTIVSLDKARMYDVLTNFLDNAFKHTQSGHIAMGYSIEDGNMLYMYVQDTGKGIALEHKKNIFKNFVKLDSFSQGLGLGLSICKHYVHAAKGTIGVDSQLGKGSTFWVRIPVEL